MKSRFSKKHFFIFVFVFLVEVYIALFVTDQIIRPFVGDVLIVVLIYSFVRTFFDVRNRLRLAVCILLFSYSVELSQYFDLVSILGLADSKLATIVIGTSFDWRDLLAYTIGFILILVGSRVLSQRKPRLSNNSHAADVG
jgi:uncharacterized membrane protein YGL010W